MIIQKPGGIQGVGGRSPIMKKHRNGGKDLKVLSQVGGFSDTLLLVPTIGFNFSKNTVSLDHEGTGWAGSFLVTQGDPIARSVASCPVR
jgi:hypothetical protein